MRPLITDRATGQQLIDSLDSPRDRIAARSAVFSQLTRKDPVEAVQLAFETDYPREQARLLSSLAERLVPTKRKTLPLTDVLWMRELEPNQRDAVEAAVHDWVSENELELPAALAEVFE